MAEKLQKSSNRNPLFGMCCLQGKIVLPLLHDLPVQLQRLYRTDEPQGQEFREHIRQYNNALAMTSLGADTGGRLHQDRQINDGHGPWVYKVQGAMHHIIGSLLPPEMSLALLLSSTVMIQTMLLNTANHITLN
jgi:hypothetical protein